MSQENVEVVQRLFEAWNRGDRGGWLAGSHNRFRIASKEGRRGKGVGCPNDRSPLLERASNDGRGWFRTSDLSRVRRSVSYGRDQRSP